MSINIQRIPTSRGFTLVEVAIVLLIIGLIVGIGLQASVAFISTEKRKVTYVRLGVCACALPQKNCFSAQQIAALRFQSYKFRQ